MKIVSSLILFAILFVSIATAQEDVLHPRGKKSAYIETETYHPSPYTLGFEIGANYNLFSQDFVVLPAYPNTACDAV